MVLRRPLLAASFGLAALVAACGPGWRLSRDRPEPKPHFVVGEPYHIGGVWQYPRVQFAYDETGLAAVDEGEHGWLTTDGESFDQSILAASHRTLQLPAIVRVTNLDSGLSVLARVNDRGPAAPGRLISLTQRAALLLKARDGSRVRVEVQEGPSRTLAASLGGDGPKLAFAAAAASDVSSEDLAPPPGAAASANPRQARPGPSVANITDDRLGPDIPLRLPEDVSQGPVIDGDIYIDAGAFGSVEFARMARSRISDLGARVVTSYDAPRDRAFSVRIGPMASVPVADAMLDRAIAAGATDARIMVAR